MQRRPGRLRRSSAECAVGLGLRRYGALLGRGGVGEVCRRVRWCRLEMLTRRSALQG